MRVIDHLKESIRRSAISYNSAVQEAPVCVLWPDRDRQWEVAISRLIGEMPELLVLGGYRPEAHTGPAIWLRCVVAGVIDDVPIAENGTPVLYLPGVGRQDLRAVEACPESLKPLIELQYRGTTWSQTNGRDWTVYAFLVSNQGGLGLDVSQDSDTKTAMQLSLYCLLDEDVERLQGKRLDNDYFNALITGGDAARDLLQWIDQGDSFRVGRGENHWRAFVEVCKSQFAFDPEREGVLSGAEKLSKREGPWAAVWERFCEAPRRYPNIPLQMRKCSAPIGTILWQASDGDYDGWPQWNDDQEADLCRELVALASMPADKARERLRELEAAHGRRRSLVWAELDEAPLARAMEYLAALASSTDTRLVAGEVKDLEAAYCSSAWQADDAVVRALSFADAPGVADAISIAIRSVYLPWVEESARYLQRVVSETSYPGGDVTTAGLEAQRDGECVVFVDGLRFDTAKRLAGFLASKGLEVKERLRWSALPSVTATGKPAVTPVRHMCAGEDEGSGLDPVVAATGQSLGGGHHLRRLLSEAGWKVLERNENGDGIGKAWCEVGNIDHEGHQRGAKLARFIDGLLVEICDRIHALIAAGWTRIRVVTDHGWLLLPGGLPKVELSSSLAEHKALRCASIKPGASTDERLYPWFWNPNRYFALADGVGCYRAGLEYSHGGLSLQECLTLELTVSAGGTYSYSTVARFVDILWRGLRCNVVIDGAPEGALVDIRMSPGDPSSSIVANPKPLREDGTASVVVENEYLEGQTGVLVLLDADGQLMAQLAIAIGGDSR